MRRTDALALLMLLAVSGSTVATARRKPLDPAAKMPALPPAQIDDALAIGGRDVKARKARTRMTVEVRINGKGPYRFVVDSGADSSVVGNPTSSTA